MPKKLTDSDATEQIHPVMEGKTVPFGQSALERGYKPTKPAGVAPPDVLPIPPRPAQSSSSGDGGNQAKK